MTFENFTYKDFINNDFFVNWILNPDDEKNAYWELFLSLHPEKQQDIMKAKAIILSFKNAPQYHLDDIQIAKIWKNIISETDIEEPIVIQTTHKLINWDILARLAAAVVFIIGSFLLYTYFEFYNVAGIRPSYEKLVTYENKKLIEKTNLSSELQKILLPDGSFVLLTHGSKISFPSKFESTRKVYLKGSGFFEVKKNAQRPFIVYAGEVITKVIGTSFWVKQSDIENKIEVDVKTGCVAVSSVNSIKQAFSELNPKFLLVANQRSIYSKTEKSLIRLLVENPIPVATVNKISEVTYTEKPIVEIFEDLQKSYNIDLVYDNDTFKNCLINTHFSDETFYEKLSILCKVINAEYDIIETQIVIKGKGCK